MILWFYDSSIHTCVLSWAVTAISSSQPCRKPICPRFSPHASSAGDTKLIHYVSLPCFLGVCYLSILITKIATLDLLGDKRGRWHVHLLKSNPLLFSVALCTFIRIYILNDQESNKPAWHLIIKVVSSGLYMKGELWIFFHFIPWFKSLLACFISAYFKVVWI